MTFSTIFKIILIAFWGCVIFISYLSSNVTEKIIKNISVLIHKQNVIELEFSFVPTYNQNIIQKKIMSRNIFNVTGEIPAEDLDTVEKSVMTGDEFHHVSCSAVKEIMPVELLGIIYTGNQKTSLVTVQDPEVEGADVYHVGNPILDYTNYSVYRIVNSNLVEFRYGMKKICLSLVSSPIDHVQNTEGNLVPNENAEDTTSSEAVLSQEYIDTEVGAGLAKIVNSARITPSNVDGKLEGFKIFAITKGSIFEKVGLRDDDVITEINQQTLTDPTKGFRIYDIFQYEKNITFTIKRGTETITRKVIVQ